MKADVFISTISIIVNTHNLLGVPSDDSKKEFIDKVWNQEWHGWKIKSSEIVHYEVIKFDFEVENNCLEGIKTILNDIHEISELILKPINP